MLNKYTQEQINNAIELCKQYKTTKEICERTKVSYADIYKLRTQFDVKIRKYKLSKEERIKRKQSKAPLEKYKNINKIKSLRSIIYGKLSRFLGTRKETSTPSKQFVNQLLEKVQKCIYCYLTGDKIDITDSSSYSFDHIIPRSRGGDNSIDNLGICTSLANQSKTAFTLEEYIEHCKKVLINFGYKITKEDERLV